MVSQNSVFMNYKPRVKTSHILESKPSQRFKYRGYVYIRDITVITSRPFTNSLKFLHILLCYANKKGVTVTESAGDQKFFRAVLENIGT